MSWLDELNFVAGSSSQLIFYDKLKLFDTVRGRHECVQQYRNQTGY